MVVDLRVSPDSSRQARDALAEGKIDTLNEGGLDKLMQANLPKPQVRITALAARHPGVREGFAAFGFALDDPR